MTAVFVPSMGARTAPGSCRCTSRRRPICNHRFGARSGARLRGTRSIFPIAQSPCFPGTFERHLQPASRGDRLVLSCLMLIDPDGEVRSYEVTPGVIRSPPA